VSNFSALNTSLSGLRASQLALDTASNNVANANTKGYTRQRMELRVSSPYASPVGPMGTGVTVESVTRLREGFLDARVRTTLGEFARLDTRHQLLSRTESLLGEPDNGISTAMGDLWSAFEDLAMEPAGPGPRRQVVGALETLTSRIRSVATGFDQLRADTEQAIGADLAEVNDLLARVHELNRIIPQETQAQGGQPNALHDERDNHLDRLAELTGATFSTDTEGRAAVVIGGTTVPLVGLAPPPALSRGATGILLGGAPLPAVGGQLGAAATFVDRDLGDRIHDLDVFAVALASLLNDQQRLDEDPAAPRSDLLVVTDGARSLRVADAVAQDPGRITAGLSGSPHDGANANAFAALRTKPLGEAQPSIEQVYNRMTVGIATDVASAKRGADAQHTIAVAAQSARFSAHGVSLDEEMADVVRFQRSLEAMSRVMSAIDEALSTLVNRTGIVGR
jgi:flagellar hook-associated protein 1